jgi:hypothetical protein
MSAAHPCPDVAVSAEPACEKEAVRRQIPSQRNRDVFAAVAMGKSHSEAAALFDLTQPRVTQIVRQVREWSVQAAGGELGEFNELQQLRMAMQEWFKSCREGLGRATYLNAASRLSSNLARLAGVDVSGKTTRVMAEQLAREEAEVRQARAAEKPLWESEQRSGPTAAAEEKVTAPTLSPATVCEKQSAPRLVPPQRAAPIKNSYELASSATVSDVDQTIKNRFPQETPPVSVPCAPKPIPKFLDKKVRKRLLALRRQEARAEALSAVGSGTGPSLQRVRDALSLTGASG